MLLTINASHFAFYSVESGLHAQGALPIQVKEVRQTLFALCFACADLAVRVAGNAGVVAHNLELTWKGTFATYAVLQKVVLGAFLTTIHCDAFLAIFDASETYRHSLIIHCFQASRLVAGLAKSFFYYLEII